MKKKSLIMRIFLILLALVMVLGIVFSSAMSAFAG